MQRLISAAHFNEINRYLQDRPLEDGWRQNAHLMHLVAKVAGNKHVKVEDFLPSSQEPSIEDQMNMIIGKAK